MYKTFNNGIVFLLPLPPPFAGPEIMAFALINAPVIKDSKNIFLINGNINKKNATRGQVTLKGFFNFFKIMFKLLVKFPKTKILFLYFSSSKLGFLKDSIFMLTARLFGNKVIAQYHGSRFNVFYNNQKLIYRRYIKFVLNKLNIVLALDSSLKSIFKEIIPPEKIYVLPNGLDFLSFTNIKGIKDSAFTIFFMGHLWYPKGFYDLVVVYKKLFIKYKNRICFKFAGENIGYTKSALDFLSGKYANYFIRNGVKIDKDIQDFINNNNEYNAKYLGFISGDEKIKQLKSASLFVLPSYTEGFSMSSLEAMAAGLPVIVTPVGAMQEVVKDGINGKITPIGNQEELEKNIEFFINNPKEHFGMSQYNPKYVKSNFDIEVIANQLLKTIDSVQ